MYGSLGDWRDYATARGNSDPADASDIEATAALVRASDYIRLRYVANLLAGYDATTTPDGSSYPLVEEASFIAANFELSTSGFFSKTYTAAEQKVLTEVKGIKWTVTGDASRKHAAMPVATLIEALFEPYVLDPNNAEFMFQSIGPDGQ